MRFVVHFHSHQKNHYDLMIEKNESLITWQIEEKDLIDILNGKIINVKKIQDHRKVYLDYEGPITCDRGYVEIFDTGEYEEIEWNNLNIILNFFGKKITGKLQIINRNNNYTLKLSARG